MIAKLFASSSNGALDVFCCCRLDPAKPARYTITRMVEFKKENYFVGFWFVGGTDRDWLACVWREQGQADWRLVHRFRYHSGQSSDPFDGKDRKSFHEAGADGTKKDEGQIVEDMGKLAKVVGLGLGAEPQFVPVRGDGDKALFELAMQPWAHIRMCGTPG